MPGLKARFGAKCFVIGCEAKHSAKGFCRTHYGRLRNIGQLHPAKMGRPFGHFKYGSIPEMIAIKATVTDSGCWVWSGTNRSGYGQVSWLGKKVSAHRLVYAGLVGSIPDGLVLDHLCRNRACVNPFHLEPVTDKINLLRGIGPSAQNSRKMHCPAGHPYDESNTYRNPKGHRFCRKCDATKKRALKTQTERSLLCPPQAPSKLSPTCSPTSSRTSTCSTPSRW